LFKDTENLHKRQDEEVKDCMKGNKFMLPFPSASSGQAAQDDINLFGVCSA